MRRINHRKVWNVFILMASFLLTASKAKSFDFRSSLESIGSKTLFFFQNSTDGANESDAEISKESNGQEQESKVSSSFGWEITNSL